MYLVINSKLSVCVSCLQKWVTRLANNQLISILKQNNSMRYLCYRLGNSWSEVVYHQELLEETLHLLPWLKEMPKIEEKPVPSANPQFNFNITPKQENDKEIICTCKISSIDTLTVFDPEASYNCPHHLSIINKDTDTSSGFDDSIKYTKERHMSIDSARDSGIGDNSNFTDADTLKLEDNLDEVPDCLKDDVTKRNDSNEINYQVVPNMFENALKSENCSLGMNSSSDVADNLQCNAVDMRGFWEPKQKRSITERLPRNTFYLIAPSRYIFPGAEVYYDPDEKYNYFDSNSTSDSSESESEVEKPDS